MHVKHIKMMKVISYFLILTMAVQETVGGHLDEKRSLDGNNKGGFAKELFRDKNFARIALLEWANSAKTKGGGDPDLTELSDGLLEQLAAQAVALKTDPELDLTDRGPPSRFRERMLAHLKDKLDQLEDEKTGPNADSSSSSGSSSSSSNSKLSGDLPKSRNSRNRLMHQLDFLEKFLDEHVKQNQLSKRGEGPQLSVTGPLDAIRRQLLLQYMHRQMQKTEKQIEENRKMLETIGKRSIPDSELAMSPTSRVQSSNDESSSLNAMFNKDPCLKAL